LKIHGVNQIGLERAGFSKESIEALKKAHKVIFRQNLTLKEALLALSADFPRTEEIRHLSTFLASASRGLVR
jgi:UDP-N-acetylglucosamine acyltransferase